MGVFLGRKTGVRQVFFHFLGSLAFVINWKFVASTTYSTGDSK